MATREEAYSTRGRARLLFEMMRGDVLRDGFASAEVEDALNLCLACKGCKHDCPVEVDMAAYKSEFRARHYAHKMRPRAAYSMGQIQRWAHLASHAPGLANFATRAPVIGNIAKLVGGIAQARTMPPFASQTFRAWHRKHRPAKSERRVILFPDTFNNYFRVHTPIAATHVLEQLGFRVDIPGQPLCCGRPLYDWGWIGQAKALWRQTLATLQPDIEAGVTIIGLEPACVSAFRDELPELFPDEPLAKALSKQMRLFSEFLNDQSLVPQFKPRDMSHALVQFHCHHHAVLDKEAEKKVLSALPVETEYLQAGCCGMAGSFGFESEKYALSQTIGERAIFSRIRNATGTTAILANGFSCREQIEQATGRKTLHLAEFLAGS
jgi:Fe-S oxidoreductase